MPNHCYQTVTITGPRALISQIEDNLKCKEARFCDLIAPMPFEIWVGEDVKITKPVNTTLPSWYEWRNENWGTKWDVCEVELGDLRLIGDGTTKEIEFQCWTAWAPPIPVWDRLIDLGCEVDADYQDEGGMFEGTYKDGLDECWVPAEDEDEEDMNLDKDVYEEEE